MATKECHHWQASSNWWSHIFLCSARITILVTGLLVWRLPPLAVDLRLPMCHDHNWYHFDHYCNNDDDTCAKAKGWNLSVKNGFDGWSWCWWLWRRRIFIEGDFNLPRGLPPLLCVGPGVSILFLVETTSFCVNTDDSHNMAIILKTVAFLFQVQIIITVDGEEKSAWSFGIRWCKWWLFNINKKK